MISFFKKKIRSENASSGFDWILCIALLCLSAIGLLTMSSFTGENYFFQKQLISVAISFGALVGLSFGDYHFLRRTPVIVALFVTSLGVLTILFLLGTVSKGAQSWFRFGSFAFQPSDPVKLVLIAVLSKYFSRRHIEIAHIRHIFVSGIYAGILFLMVILEPDFGSAMIIFSIWLGMVLVSGISKKHLLIVFLIGAVSFGGLWRYGFAEYQKKRIMNFIHPLADIRGSGYNAFQSTIAVGSGQILGKGLGFGTQSRLNFLPEYQTDFIFAAFAEEWGFVGIIILLMLFGIVFWRLLLYAYFGATNFEVLFALGVVIYFASHVAINIGMNMGVLPVTGLPLPFVSYGGSHLLTECIAVGVLMGMRKYGRGAHAKNMQNEFLGI